LVTVPYADGATRTYDHEFGLPDAVERAPAIALFETPYVDTDGWIPERLHGKVMASAGALQEAVQPLQVPLDTWEETGVVRFEVRFPDRRRAYQAAIVDGMRDLIAAHRDPSHAMTVTGQDARDRL